MNSHTFPLKNQVCRNISLIFNSFIVSFVKVHSFISYFARILDCLDRLPTLCLRNGMRLMGRYCLYGRTDNFLVPNKDWFVINQRAQIIIQRTALCFKRKGVHTSQRFWVPFQCKAHSEKEKKGSIMAKVLTCLNFNRSFKRLNRCFLF